MPTHPASPTDHDLVDALVRALGTGPIDITFRDDLADEHLAAAYYRAEGRVELNPAASPREQAVSLVRALDGIAGRERPVLRVLPGGRS